jgi:hypothetical protein
LGSCEEQHIVAGTALKMRYCLVIAMLAQGCASAPNPRASQPPPAPVRPAAEAQLADRGWAVLRSRALGLKLALPEGRSWLGPEARSNGPGSATASWELRHEPTGSSLSVRRWRASRLPQLEQCELELRQRVPNVPEIDETSLVAERQVRVPAGFVTRLVLLQLSNNSARLRGQVLAIGAGVGECLAAIATTESRSEVELAERLRLFDAALSHMRLSHVEDRVPEPEPLPP